MGRSAAIATFSVRTGIIAIAAAGALALVLWPAEEAVTKSVERTSPATTVPFTENGPTSSQGAQPWNELTEENRLRYANALNLPKDSSWATIQDEIINRIIKEAER